MSKDNVISLENPAENKDLLSSLLRSGARQLITKAVQTEPTEFLSQYQDMTDPEGRPLLIYLKGISTGDFSEALAGFIGEGCKRSLCWDNRSPQTMLG